MAQSFTDCGDLNLSQRLESVLGSFPGKKYNNLSGYSLTALSLVRLGFDEEVHPLLQ